MLAIVNQVPKLGIVLKETLIELSLWSEAYIMRVSVSNGCVLETWGSWVKGSGRCEGNRFIRNGGSQPQIQYLPFVIGVRFDSFSKITMYEGQQRNVIFEVTILRVFFVCRTAVFIS